MVKKLLMKNRFIKHYVNNYRLGKKHPSWKLLLKRNKNLWRSALAKAKTENKVLIATSVGVYFAGTTFESMLAVALTLRGAQAHVFLCDGILPACLGCTMVSHPDQKHFAKYGPLKDLCIGCFSSASKIFRSLGIKVHRYSDFLTDHDIKKVKEISSTIKLKEIGNYTLDSIKVGEHALAGALRFFARGNLDNEPYAEPILRRYFQASLLTTFSITKLLQRYKFTSAVFHHGIYVPQGLIAEVCRKMYVRVVTWWPGYKTKTFVLSHGDTYHRAMMSEPTDKWEAIPWSESLDSQLREYLRSRWEGTYDWIWFHYKPEFNLENFLSSFNIDPHKPCIGALTSVMWDAVLHYPSNAFPNMLEWLKCTIDYFVKRQDLQLLIRVHPAEIRGTLPSRQRAVDEINKIYTKLPKNIILIPPENNISTYPLMSQCDTIIIYNTKTGVELTAMGMPVIVAGEAWIRDKGFAIDVHNPSQYLQALNKLPLRKRMAEEDVLKAKKYAFHFFFRRMIPLEFVEKSQGNPPYRLNLRNLDELMPGESLGLDVMCEGILKGKDFIYPAETRV
jgi:hypothetical protein